MIAELDPRMKFDLDENLLVKYHLTERQKEILKVLVQGYINKEAAELLGIAWSTLKNHAHAIMKRMRFSRMSDLRAHLIIESMKNNARVT